MVRSRSDRAARARRVPRGTTAIALIAASALAVLLARAPAIVLADLRSAAANGLPYSAASANAVQRQPAPGSCRARGAGVYSRPDSRCTPGALNPAVTQSTTASTICRSGWTRTVRPHESVTEPEKFASMRAYGDRGSASRFEYDHLVPLELGGAVNDARNLWPEPDYAEAAGFYKNPKDELENTLKRRVCDGRMSLSQAQRAIVLDWPAAYRRYG